MAEDHFKLDVDLESLRAAKKWLGMIGDHLRTEGPKMAQHPGEIGDGWTGPAADKIKGEMTNLGNAVKAFAPDFDSAEGDLKTFIDAVETFQSTTLVTYNQKWETANQNAEDEIAKDESKRGTVASGLRYTLQAIDYQYNEEKDALVTKAKTLGTDLGDLTAVPVPDSVATRFINGGGSGTHITWTDDEGDFPPDLDANSHLGDSTLSEDLDQQEAGEEAAEQFNNPDGGNLTPEEAKKLAEAMNSDSEAFRAAFLNNLDPEKLAEFHQFASESGTADNGGSDYGALITAIAQTMSKGSKSENQPTYPVDSNLLDEVVDAYTSVDNEHDPDVKTKGYLRLSELVAAGQGDPPTWDSDFLAEVTRKTIAYEREQVENDEFWSWGPAAGEMSWLTEKGADWYGDTEDTKNPYWGDPLVLYFEAMENDSAAAQQTLVTDGPGIDEELTEYLYGRKAGHGGNYGWALGKFLESATLPKGAGEEGSPEYISADLVADLVDYYAAHDLGLNMDESIVNILTNHVEAVNHATDEDTGYLGNVVPPLEGSNFPYEWINRANLTQEDMSALLNKVFGLDYYSNQIAEEGDPPTHNFPLYTQLALAMELSAQEEFHYVAKNGDPGQLETLVNDLSQSQQRTLNSFVAALEGEGRDADQRTDDARAALDFVLGIAKDQVPTGKGLPSTIAGEGLDKVQELLLNAVIPETDYEQAAAQDASLEEYRQQLTSLKLVKWLDEAGQLPEQNSPQQWAEDHPDQASFVVDGEFVDPGELYRNRDENPQAWNDFRRYYENSGRAWLANIDLDEQYTLGWLEEGS